MTRFGAWLRYKALGRILVEGCHTSCTRCAVPHHEPKKCKERHKREQRELTRTHNIDGNTTIEEVRNELEL